MTDYFATKISGIRAVYKYSSIVKTPDNKAEMMQDSLTANSAQIQLRSLSSDAAARNALRFFKTGSGDYGEGDKFLGISVPVLRAQTKRYAQMPIDEVLTLLRSGFHEERLFSLLLLVHQFERSDAGMRQAIYESYMEHTEFINNWDLVDCSAYKIVGAHLSNSKSRESLYKLAKSSVLWERRIAIISTLWFIKNADFKDALRISALLLKDEEDLIHKAAGWMLREIGKLDKPVEEAFLNEHYTVMPRTMLRYAIEKFPEKQRQLYLTGTA